MPFATERIPSYGVPYNVWGEEVKKTLDKLVEHCDKLQDEMKKAEAAGDKKLYRQHQMEYNRATGALGMAWWLRGENGQFAI